MLETLIASYISTLNEELVEDYAKSQNIFMTPEESKTITKFLKENWRDLFHQRLDCLEKLKPNIEKTTYDKALLLYKDVREKYLS